jgi:hypothetical protein
VWNQCRGLVIVENQVIDNITTYRRIFLHLCVCASRE